MYRADQIKLTDGTVINEPYFDITELGGKPFIRIYGETPIDMSIYVNIDFIISISEMEEIIE